MSDAKRYSVARKLTLRIEAACDLCWVAFKMNHEPWAWARAHLRPVSGREDPVASIEIEKAAQSAAGLLPFTMLCVPSTVTAMRMLRRRGISAALQWVPPGVRNDRGHIGLAR